MLFTLTLNAQDSYLDSLETELSVHLKKDTTRVILFNKLAFGYHRKDINKTIEYLNESETLARELDFQKGLAKNIYIKGVSEVIQSNLDTSLYYFNKSSELYEAINSETDSIEHYAKIGLAECYNGSGIVYYYKGEYQKSIQQYEKALFVYKGLNDTKNIAKSSSNLGSTYADLGNYKKAVELYEKALKEQIKLGDEYGTAKTLNNLGTVYDDQGNYPLALENYNKLLYFSEKASDSLGISKALNNIGIIYRRQNKYVKALECYERSLAIHESNRNTKNIAQIKNNIGIIHKQKGSYNLALTFFKESLAISTKNKNKDGSSRCLNNIGAVYFKLNDYQTALKYFELAKDINLETGDQLGLCNSYLGIADSYYEQGNYLKALDYTRKSHKISNELQTLKPQRDVHLIFSEIYDKLKKHEQAFIHHKQFKVLDDSLLNEERIRKLSAIEYEYKYKQELDSASIRELKLNKTIKKTSKSLEQSQRNYLIAIIVILIVSIISGAVIFIQKLRNANALNQNILIEQKLLRSQMTPHFIFNSLSVLQGMILNKEEIKSVSYLSKFSKLLRTILENSRHKTVLLSSELDAINSYMALHNLDASPPYNYILNIDNSIHINKLKIPPMLIQPFIENAIEHAFSQKKENREIILNLTFNDDILKCTIEDNGTGFDASKKKNNTKKKSLATTITSERLDMISKDFNMKGSIEIKNKKSFGQEGTLVTLTIPYKIYSN